ncbi:hypothetical protein N1I81_22570 [Bacillus sp. FSL M8-0052]|uniref:Uncharacterized protein n=1 Tax=Bacillus glycinifermentans TaxID=1664069 RepID=A0AAJ3Z4S9_9BACI|nr:hypothetical protein [Bacillus glycinifermentans]QAT68047.1 hypothetical protein EQZ20_24550 [Bacillus glycinifermentans]
MANITIKGVSENTKTRLADKAKKAGLSEQKYLKKLLDTHVIAEEVEGVQSTYEELCKTVLTVVEKNTEVLREFIRVNEE